MKALTLIQPWASLIAEGHKRIETRSWRAPSLIIGKRIAIHAGKKVEKGADDFEWRAMLRQLLGDGWEARIPKGAIVATAILSSVEQCTLSNRPGAPELWLGDYAPGRFMWHLHDVIRLEKPLPCRGYQNFWSLDAAISSFAIAYLENGRNIL